MKLLSRHVSVTKPYELVYQIIKSSSYCISKWISSVDSFSMYCAKRFNGGIVSVIPVKGIVLQHNHVVEVKLSVHAGFSFYMGCVLALLGIAELLFCLIAHSSRWIPGVGMIGLGLLFIVQYLWEGIMLLDRLEHKLLNE